MGVQNFSRLQALVFLLVWATFATINITQPVLPVLQEEFGGTASAASLTMSAVILGMALANPPFGILADRFSLRRLILMGGLMVAATSFVCAISHSLWFLVVARFVQGLFIPCLSTCVAAYLSLYMPLAQLNVVMGAYVSATVAGGLSGRLLGGWLHQLLHWRYAFVVAGLILIGATLAATRWLPYGDRTETAAPGDWSLRPILAQPELRMIFLVSFGAFGAFSSTFNYLPFYLTGPPFQVSTKIVTMLYLTYLAGIIVGPLAGNLSNRIGNGTTMILGSLVFAAALAITLIQSKIAIVAALIGVCAGFSAIHAAAAGALNRKLTKGRGRANSLYLLFYYMGGAVAITLSGYAYCWAGWRSVVTLSLVMLLLPCSTGFRERRLEKKGRPVAEEPA